MLRIPEETTLVPVTELRRQVPRVLREITRNKVLLTCRNKPVGVVIDYAQYERWERMMEELEDFLLGHLALRRAARRAKRLVPLEEAERRMGLR